MLLIRRLCRRNVSGLLQVVCATLVFIVAVASATCARPIAAKQLFARVMNMAPVRVALYRPLRWCTQAHSTDKAEVQWRTHLNAWESCTRTGHAYDSRTARAGLRAWRTLHTRRPALDFYRRYRCCEHSTPRAPAPAASARVYPLAPLACSLCDAYKRKGSRSESVSPDSLTRRPCITQYLSERLFGALCCLYAPMK